jgi:hypothetical protein
MAGGKKMGGVVEMRLIDSLGPIRPTQQHWWRPAQQRAAGTARDLLLVPS